MEIGKLVELYIALRDRRSTRKKSFEVDDDSDKRNQEKIEAKLLSHFNTTGTDKAGCAAGTAYISHRTSATVADWEIVSDFIKENMEERWSMLEHRISKKFVEAYVEDQKELPPGINMTKELTVNVRRAS